MISVFRIIRAKNSKPKNSKFSREIKTSNFNAIKIFRFREKRFNISNSRNHMRIFEVINRNRDISFSTNAISMPKRLNMSHNIAKIKPSVSQKDKVTFFIFIRYKNGSIKSVGY